MTARPDTPACAPPVAADHGCAAACGSSAHRLYPGHTQWGSMAQAAARQQIPHGSALRWIAPEQMLNKGGSCACVDKGQLHVPKTSFQRLQ